MNGVEFNEIHEFFGRASVRDPARIGGSHAPRARICGLALELVSCDLRPEADVRVAIRVERRCR